MAFPEDRLVHRLQAAFGADADASPTTWSWTDITDDIHAQQISITRGTANEAGQAEPTSISLVLDNVSGDYTPDNPLGAHYPDIELGVPLRYSVQGPPYLGLEGSGRASTPDAAAIDITGSIDVRTEIELDDWFSGDIIELAGKYRVDTNQRSWLWLYSDARALVFRWSPDGVAIPQYISTVPVPVPASGRIALRSTLDTTTGVVTHYTADSIDGPWVQLGDASTPSGATSLFNSDQPLTVGEVPGVGFTAPQGAYHAFRLYDGINGTLVADPDFTAQSPGATSFNDSTGLTWTLAGGAQITDWHHQFNGHADSWEPVWPYGDLSDEDTGYEGEAQVTVTASGILRRLGQGEEALESTLRRRVPSFGPLAYWPMEEGASATSASSPVEGVNPLKLTRVEWASADSLASSNALPVLASSGGSLPQMLGRIPAPATAPSSWSVRYIYRLDTANTTLRTFMRILSTGTVAEWYIQQRNNLSRVFGLDADGATVFTQDIGTGANLYNDWLFVRFMATQSGGNVNWDISWFNIGGGAGASSGSFAGTVGRPTGVASPPDGYSPDLDGMALGHISAFPIDLTGAYSGAIDAWAGETAANRFARLCEEEGIPYAVVGDPDDSEAMGPQRPAPFLDLLGECAALDGGRLGERRSSRGLLYRTRADLYNQAARLVLDAGNNEIANPFAPVLDDQRIRNDITVTRDGGSSARAVDEASVTRRRRYRDSPTVNAHTDAQLPDLAGWRLHLGTWPGMRYPSVSFDLSIAPHLIDTWLRTDTGDRLKVANLPPQHPTDLVDLLLEGYTQTLSPTRWTVQGNCVPYGPYIVAGLAVYEDFEDTAFEVTATNGGTLPWARSTAHFNTGSWSLRSGAIGNNQTSDWIVTVPAGSTEMQFWYWTSSENSGPGFEGDRLLVLVDGVEILRAQGTTGWTQAIADVTGKSTVTFRYAKDNSAASGEDAVHIDDLAFTGIAPTRADTDASELAAGIDADDTSLSVAVTDGPLWVTSATFPQEFPFTVRVGGEDMTVTAVTGTTSPQTFTVTRSVNGVVKAHTAGDDLRLAVPAITAL